MSALTTPTTVEFPALLQAADSAAATSQALFLRLKKLELASLCFGAASGIVPESWAGGFGPAVSVVAFLLVMLLQVSRAGERAESRWYDARATAESIKSASWQYAVGGEAYRLSTPDATERFAARMADVMATVPDLNLTPAEPHLTPTVTPGMAAVRSLPQTQRAQLYRRLRVEDQLAWYHSKAIWNRQRSMILTGVTIAVEAVAVLAGLLRFKLEATPDVLGVLAAVAAGLIAWGQAKKYAFLAQSYAVTTHELTLVGASLVSPADEAAWAQSVHDAEAAFSREHTMWQARRQAP